MAVMVEPPVVHTSSTMSTGALSSLKPSIFPRAVGLLCLADKKTVDEAAFASFCMMLRAGDRYRGDDRIGAQSQAADGMRIEMMFVQQIENGEAGEARAFGVQGGGAAVDVVVATAAGGELEVAQLEGLAGKQSEQLLAGA